MNNQSVYVLFADGKTNYILAKSGNSYVVSSSLIGPEGLDTGSLYIPTFTVSVINYPTLTTNSPISYRLKDTVGYYLTYDEENQTIISNPQKSDSNVCRSSQSEFQSWRAPSAFLAGAKYNLTIGEHPPMIPISGQPNTLDISQVDTYFLPTIWYRKDECVKASSSEDALVYHYCYVTGDDTFKCSDVPIGWTVMSDCKLGLYYPYCTEGLYCSADCKAPCSRSSDGCQWNTKIESFQCNLNVNNIVNGPWWRSYIFLGIISFIICILLVTLFFIPITHIRDHDKKGEVYDDRLGEVMIENYKNVNI